MTARHLANFKLRTLLIVVSIISFACAYVSNYLLTLNPAIHITHTGGGLITGHRKADYHAGGQFAHLCFAPIHFVDRQIRPSYWNSWCAFDEEGDLKNLNIYRGSLTH